jgi:tRNA (guanine6-N2)-methyltransferase
MENASAAGVSVEARVADAVSLPLAAGAAARVVSNPPWGRAVEPAGGIRRSLQPFWSEIARIVEPDGRCVVLAPAEAVDVAVGLGLHVLLRTHISLFGAHVEMASISPIEQEPIDRQAVFGEELARW